MNSHFVMNLQPLVSNSPHFLPRLHSESQYFASDNWLLAILVALHLAQLQRTEQRKKLPNDNHHDFSGKAKYPFKKNQKQTLIFGLWRQPLSASMHLSLYSSTCTKGLPRCDTYFQKQLFSFCILLWGTNYFVYWMIIILNPYSIQ